LDSIPPEYEKHLGIDGPKGQALFAVRFLFNFILEQMADICPSPSIRVALHRLRGVKMGKGVFIGNNVLIDRMFPHLVSLGDYAEIGDNTVIVCHGRGSKPLRKAYPVEVKPVVVGRGVWGGVNCIILAGVTVGEYSVLGAGSVIRKDVPPYSVVIGNPATVIKHIDRDEILPM
jgi:acetyltransferase-like isoleucine patch superfamily enzyme